MGRWRAVANWWDIILTETSEFCDPDHGHITTGDLHVVKNQRLRKLFTKGPNCRLLDEFGLYGTQSETYKLVNKLKKKK